MITALLLMLAALSSAPAHAEGCEIAPRFRRIVFDEVGKARAQTKTGFFMQVITNSGKNLCSASVMPDQEVYPASSIKTLVAIAVLKRVDDLSLPLDRVVFVDQPNAPEECDEKGCWDYADGPSRQTTVDRLLDAMIRRSSNVAMNQLLDLVGKPSVQKTAEDLGAPTIKIRRKVYVTINPEPELTERNSATARGMAAMYHELATGQRGALSQRSRGILNDLLATTVHNNRFNKDFPAGVTFHHKTGSTSDSTSDAGFYRLGSDRMVILVGLQNFKDVRTLAKIGKRAYSLVR